MNEEKVLQQEITREREELAQLYMARGNTEEIVRKSQELDALIVRWYVSCISARFSVYAPQGAFFYFRFQLPRRCHWGRYLRA